MIDFDEYEFFAYQSVQQRIQCFVELSANPQAGEALLTINYLFISRFHTIYLSFSLLVELICDWGEGLCSHVQNKSL